MREEIKNWWLQGKADLKTARDNIIMENHYAAVFFLHQAVEKSLKALCMHLKKGCPLKNSNVFELGKEVGIPERFHSFLREITRDYVATRYPDAANGIPAELYDENIARRILERGEEIIQWVASMIEK
ncbi:MAG: HEPN domain-containing protein [Candidatus Helarchaeales archaeon]